MKILILGGDGMLGHQLLEHFAPRHQVRVTLRQPLASYASFRLFRPENAYGGIELRSIDSLPPVLAGFQPEAVINAVGIVKQRPAAEEAIPSMRFPRAGGLYQVSSEPISKFDLLGLIKRQLGLGVEIVPYDFVCDRSLDSTRFRNDFNYRPPSWDAMIAELARGG